MFIEDPTIEIINPVVAGLGGLIYVKETFIKSSIFIYISPQTYRMKGEGLVHAAMPLL